MIRATGTGCSPMRISFWFGRPVSFARRVVVVTNGAGVVELASCGFMPLLVCLKLLKSPTAGPEDLTLNEVDWLVETRTVGSLVVVVVVVVVVELAGLCVVEIFELVLELRPS